ncbi:uncharacterized protein [Argopecten irradians]|uniref:uncharacterized protein n=1 Tax=Argopecten irradians TaxID=31199 RepID=UPI003719898B
MTANMYICGIWMLFIGFAYGQVQYQACVEYCGSAMPPNVTGIVNICMESNNCTYCKFVPDCCPEVACANPVPSTDGRCLICPGVDCIYDENEHIIGETFTSLDEFNSCRCSKSKKVKCTKNPIPLTLADFCS